MSIYSWYVFKVNYVKMYLDTSINDKRRLGTELFTDSVRLNFSGNNIRYCIYKKSYINNHNPEHLDITPYDVTPFGVMDSFLRLYVHMV